MLEVGREEKNQRACWSQLHASVVRDRSCIKGAHFVVPQVAPAATSPLQPPTPTPPPRTCTLRRSCSRPRRCRPRCLGSHWRTSQGQEEEEEEARNTNCLLANACLRVAAEPVKL
eukprot:755723-Hanusia_phi.AAC.7